MQSELHPFVDTCRGSTNVNYDNTLFPSRNNPSNPLELDDYLLKVCDGRKGRVWHILRRCEASRRERNLGELTPRSRVRKDYTLDLVQLEEPLTLYFSSAGRSYASIAARIGNQYHVGQGFLYEGYWQFWQFIVEFDVRAFNLRSDGPFTDQDVMPREEDRGAAISMLLTPLDQYFVTQPQFSQEMN